jgi:hypothetical protein
MSKQDFIALANVVRLHNSGNPFDRFEFTADQVSTLANFCEGQNPNFNRERWLGYIAGTNGPSGGSIK